MRTTRFLFLAGVGFASGLWLACSGATPAAQAGSAATPRLASLAGAVPPAPWALLPLPAATPRPLALAPAAPSELPPRPPEAPERGWELYQRHCSACHGVQGLGDGAAAYLLHPAPRNLVRGEYRLTSTVNAVPSDADLLAVITRGMPGSGMPPWDRLPEADRLLLAQTVRALWRADVRHGYEVEGYDAAEVEEYLAEDTVAGAELAYAAESEPTLSAIGRGRMLFTRTCAPCHGQEGRGESTQELLDSDGHPAPARDFTRGVFKGGGEAREIFARLRTGMRGTPMPAYDAASLRDEDAWNLVHYIRSLFPPQAQERQRQRYTLLTAPRVATLPEGEANWAHVVPSTYLALMPLWWRDRRVEGVLVQAAHDGATLALRLQWDDATQDTDTLGMDAFPDGAAVQVSTDADPPFFGMGDSQSPVTLWAWKAACQQDLDGWRDVESRYPAMNLDTYYPVQGNVPAGERPALDAVGAEHHQPLFLSGWGAGNPLSQPRPTSAVEVGLAQGQGTLATAAPAAQTASGRGTWEKGVWTLELRAPLPAAPGAEACVAFAVWDGSQSDRNGQKSVTIWHCLNLEK